MFLKSGLKYLKKSKKDASCFGVVDLKLAKMEYGSNKKIEPGLITIYCIFSYGIYNYLVQNLIVTLSRI